MSGHLSERFTPRESDAAADQETPQSEEHEDMTPPLSLIGGAAGQMPAAIEERASGIDMDPSTEDHKRDDES